MNQVIAILSPGEIYGGAERQIVDLCSHYIKYDLPITVFLFHRKELASRIESLGITPVILGGHKYSFSNARNLASEIKSKEIDVVHAHGYRAMITCALARKKKEFGIVKTEHGLPEKSGNSLFKDFRTTINHKLDLWATNNAADAVCYVTDDILQRYNQIHKSMNRQVTYNGMNPLESGHFSKPDAFKVDQRNIVIAGRVSEVKGIKYAIQAFAESAMPGNTVLHIVGDGPLLGSHRALAEKLGVTDKIIFHGFQHNALDFIAHADVLLMPSLHEGLPYTLLEAMSLGTPVIVSAVGGMAEIITNNITGVLMPSKNSQAIVEACSTVLGDEQFARTLSENAAKLQREKFTLDKMAESYLKVYSDVSR
jgi:glycosyltransferase involved in cell wall biosynthesis